jgi:hypothetical protein
MKRLLYLLIALLLSTGVSYSQGSYYDFEGYPGYEFKESFGGGISQLLRHRPASYSMFVSVVREVSVTLDELSGIDYLDIRDVELASELSRSILNGKRWQTFSINMYGNDIVIKSSNPDASRYYEVCSKLSSAIFSGSMRLAAARREAEERAKALARRQENFRRYTYSDDFQRTPEGYIKEFLNSVDNFRIYLRNSTHGSSAEAIRRGMSIAVDEYKYRLVIKSKIYEAGILSESGFNQWLNFDRECDPLLYIELVDTYYAAFVEYLKTSSPKPSGHIPLFPFFDSMFFDSMFFDSMFFAHRDASRASPAVVPSPSVIPSVERGIALAGFPSVSKVSTGDEEESILFHPLFILGMIIPIILGLIGARIVWNHSDNYLSRRDKYINSPNAIYNTKMSWCVTAFLFIAGGGGLLLFLLLSYFGLFSPSGDEYVIRY